MALLTLGSVVTDIRGSIAGTVYSRNRGGAYARGRTVPLNPKTSRQGAVRAAFGANAKAWSSILTADQRAAWTFFAQNNPVVNRLGAAVILSGLAMYTRLNQVLAQIGSPAISDPPADLSVPALASPIGVSLETTGPILNVQTNAQDATTGALYYIFATGPVAPGRKPPTSAYRWMNAPPSVATDISVDFTTPWVATFGAPPVGQVIGVSCATANSATGALTPPIIFEGTITT